MAPRTEAAKDTSKFLTALQPSIGRLHDKAHQDAEVTAIIGRLGLTGTVADWRKRLGNAARDNRRKASVKLEDVFKKKAETIIQAEYLQGIGFERLEESELEEAEPVTKGAASSSAQPATGHGRQPKGRTPVKLKFPAQKTQQIIRESPGNGTSPARPQEQTQSQSKKRVLESTEEKPLAKRMKTTRNAAASSSEPDKSQVSPRAAVPSNKVDGPAITSTLQAAEPATSSSSSKRKRDSDQDDASPAKRTKLADSQTGENGALQSTSAASALGARPVGDDQNKLMEAEIRIRNLERQVTQADQSSQGSNASLTAVTKQAPSAHETSLQAENKRLKEELRETTLKLKTQTHDNNKLSCNAVLRKARCKDVLVSGRRLEQHQAARMNFVSDAASDLTKTYKMVEQLVDDYLNDREMDIMSKVQLSVVNPGSASPQQKKLEGLYAQIFCTDDWKKEWLKTQQWPEEEQFRARDIFLGLIAAGVYKSVFSCSTPWDLKARLRTALGDSYQSVGKAGEAAQVDESLNLSQYLIIKDDKFEDQISGHAKALSEDLIDTLMPHMKVWHAEELCKGNKVNLHSEWTAQWMEVLETIFKEAVTCKSLMETYEDGSYETSDFKFVWLKPGEDVDQETATPLNGLKAKHPQRIRMTLWPGMKTVLAGPLRAGFEDQIKLHVPVRAVTRNVPEADGH